MRIKIAIAGAVIGFALLAAPVFAQGSPSPFPTPRKGSALTQASLRSCQARESAVKNRMESLKSLATNIEEKFDAIAKRVENFYTGTVLPGGKTVSNYDALVADITAKKNVVTTDLNKAQNDINNFNCTSDDPRGLLRQFRVDMQQVKSDLKSYRTTIKNLIVAVRPLAGSPEQRGTEKPERTEKPEATP